ncbi:hypothetical protein PAXRUDRAFT_20759 [Paxillus rubicundulus Ve08.2h10]|uniref:Uncharacterized protein n=1 Tax=Paxillus rubicundulus Ve08.2h10 TaxID=930991 RepID=A0A0D0CRU3_9AGAM|nr:hypothetical protein PAXRUDRAFT_20759 [Paxillus rubicundulus Ve08.2h10]
MDYPLLPLKTLPTQEVLPLSVDLPHTTQMLQQPPMKVTFISIANGMSAPSANAFIPDIPSSTVIDNNDIFDSTTNINMTGSPSPEYKEF